MTAVLALWLAWLADAAFGEPRSAWHPVAWFGRAAAPVGHWARSLRPAWALGAGAFGWCALVGAAAAAAWWLQQALADAPAWLAVPLLALALKPSFAWRMLADEVHAVDAALSQGLAEGRARLAWLCSRDVQQLDAATVRETAIETLAENLNDSLVAPLFWFVVAGLPGAWAWRTANTLDAMWGYRGRWEWAGKVAARADDLLAWLPARITAVLLWRPGVAWIRLRAEARRTPSPNGGWPMAAMALHLGVRLHKPGVYMLNADAPPPQAPQVQQALRHGRQAAWAAVLLAGLALLALAAWQGVP
ncbi:adenosylcobinamide-phosphate synthase CbiB [Pseudaquabacterium pictum]|uniref:Cobalamin biosynthesis protein CobD n=1 Tax=Pseudaquabacterium pictum TaxID=2315236 RepID=A0A480ARL4_9BURK|nr:adenosylcobinamide-phosphate synthase CbiB [Rubrivivax pictus]GCL61388.1 cobalamin biosynthesis protein CobD [Rubrivivax pictus]